MIDPTEHEIADLTPKVQQIDDVEELEAMLDREAEGEEIGRAHV